MLLINFKKFLLRVEMFVLEKCIGKDDAEYEKYRAIVENHRKQLYIEIVEKNLKEFWK